MRTHSLSLVSSFVMVALAGGHALAESDGKTNAGAACLAAAGSAKDIARQVDGRADNDQPRTATFICPVEADIGGGRISSASVTFRDGSTTDSVRCVLSKRSRTTGGLDFNTVASSVPNVETQTLFFSGGVGDVDGVDSYYLMTCQVPGVDDGARSSVFSHKWIEQG